MYKYAYIKTYQHQYEGYASNFLWERMIIKFHILWVEIFPLLHFSTFAWNAICCLHKTLLKGQSSSCVLYFSSSLSARQVLGVHLQGAIEMYVRGSKVGGWGLHLSSSLAETFKFVVCCMYCFEWIVALLFKNSTNISTLSQEMLATTLLTEGCTLNFFSLILHSCQMYARSD